MEDRQFTLSPLDHLMPRHYAANLLYFPISNLDTARITSILKSSLQRTFEALPILSGTVQSAPNSEQDGTLCVGAPWNKLDEVFRVNDLSSSNLDYENLRQNNFPMTASNEHDILTVLRARPNPLGFEHPVMLAQVNFVRNGMILVQFLHHSVMDGLGGAVVTDVWASFCRGGQGTEMIKGGMTDRERLMSGDGTGRLEDFPEYIDVSESSKSGKKLQDDVGGRSLLGRGYSLATYIFQSLRIFSKKPPTGPSSSATAPGSTHSAPRPPKGVETEMFFFSRSKLSALKSAVSASVASTVSNSSDSKVPSYISTNDALSALLFTCVTQARKAGQTTDIPQAIPLALTVSGRRLLNPPLPENYIGNMSLFCHLDLPLHTVTPDVRSMAPIAHQIRKRLSQLDDSHVKRLVGALHTLKDTSKVAPACRASKDWPFMVTPWTGQGFYRMDWGSEIGVKCERVRVPKMNWPDYDGVIVVLPELKAVSGVEDEEAGLEVMIGLEKGAMRRLREMEEWTTWAKWRCS